MKIVYSNNEFKPGTMLRRMYFYDDDGDVIMTDGPVYEEIQEDDSDQHYDGPEEDDSDQHYDGPEDDDSDQEEEGY